jgi:uracil-DNA glycosylase
MFTGDSSGDVLYAALHRTGFATLPTSVAAGDGQSLTGIRIVAAVRCAPPANKPTIDERDRCRPFLERELALLERARVYVVLGQFGYQVLCGVMGVRPRPRFGHGVEVALPARSDDEASRGPRTILCSYHVSQQNTFTGKLTPPMLDDVLHRAAEIGR